MSKRFTDTEKWKDSWYRNLPWKSKLFWEFLYTQCDIAGFWKIDVELACFMINEKIDIEGSISEINGGKERIIKVGCYLKLVDFIQFQYGTLTDSCRPHHAVLALLEKHRSIGLAKGIDTLTIGLAKGIDTLVDKEKEKEKEKEIKDAMVLPEDLESDREYIEKWIAYKKEKGHKYKPVGLNALFEKIRLIPKEKRAASINHSMANGWQGLFEAKEDYGNRTITGKAKPEPGDYDEYSR